VATVEVRWHERERDGTHLWCADYGGAGPPAMLLHGLAGHAREWDSTAAWLADSHRVVAPEARGHGRSERTPRDRSPEAFALDAEMWIERLGLAAPVLIGQSFGGLIALLVAARGSVAVSGLVVAEATPAEDPGGTAAVASWLASWPVPFPSADKALAFFGGDTLWARAWSGGLEVRGDGLWPAFDADVLLDALGQANARSYWEQWAAIGCPALVVCADNGVSRAVAGRMLELLPDSRLSEIADAGHDVHLDRPERWQAAVRDFLAELTR
jgi:pimeloyl-ACP methyl ester carboxylesterase